MLLNTFIILSFFQKLPLIFESYYKFLTVILFILFFCILVGILSEISIHKNIEKIVLVFVFLSVYSVCIEFLAKITSNSQINSKELILPLLFIVIGKYSPISKNYYIIYTWQSVILGLSIVYYYVGTFEILTNYAYGSKNQIGPMIAFGAVIALVYSFYTHNRWNKAISISFFIVILIVLMLIRARATLVALLAASIILVIFNLNVRIKNRLNYRLIFFFLVSMSLLFLLLSLEFFQNFRQSIISFVIQAFTKNYNIYDLNSLSAGRTIVYKEVLKSVFWEAPFGLVNKEILIAGTPHNYILNKALNVGYIGALPYVYLYIYLFRISLFQSKSNMLCQISSMLLFVGLIVGLFEYTLPFGPFSSTYIIWFSLGQAIRKREEIL